MTYEEQTLDYARDIAYHLVDKVGDSYLGNVAGIRRMVCAYIKDLDYIVQTTVRRADREDYWMSVADWYERGVQDKTTVGDTA